MKRKDSEDFSEKDLHFSNDSGPGLVRQAGLYELTQQGLGATFAGSESIREMPELLWQIREGVERKEDYLQLEESLARIGYQKHWIRAAFLQETGIDPVQAFLDESNFSLPPGEVPRYNYGWGKSKNAKYDYCFILPIPDKRIGVIGQKDLTRTILSDFASIVEAREALGKLTKDVLIVSPESSPSQNEVHPLFRVANLSTNGKDLYEKVLFLKEAYLTGPLLKDALTSDIISEDDYEILQKVADDAITVDPEVQDEGKDFDKYRDEAEGFTIDEIINKTKIPNDDFKSRVNDRGSLSIPTLVQEAMDVFTAHTSSVPEFTFKVVAQDADLLNRGVSVSEDDSLDPRSVSFIVEVSAPDENEPRLILVVMTIQNNDLRYSGRFKGENDREYGLNSSGLQEYFTDLQGEEDLSLPTSDDVSEAPSTPSSNFPG